MKNILFASPLYILRKECTEDLFAALSKLGDLGFNGIEFLSFFGKSGESVREKLEELDMVSLGNHVGYNEFLSDIKGTLDLHKKAGCKYITVGTIPTIGLPGGEKFSGTIKQLTKLGQTCKEEGITLLYHNHAGELTKKIQGKYILEVILDEIPGDCLALEPDLGWMAIGGADPSFFLEKYKNRCPVIHLKDFYASDISRIGNVGDLGDKRGTVDNGNFEFRPLGYGIANIPIYMDKVLACDPEWIVIDHDLAYDRNSYEDLKVSLSYVKQLITLI
ncbi:MAG TPA: sugar phosphate isomerase/epimerase [Clostridiaceae bacterium]